MMEALRNIAISAAKEAGTMLGEAFGSSEAIGFQGKQDASRVTKFDLDAEKKIVARIRSQFPDHAILAEEGGGTIGDGYTWLIDPLDGTTNFSMKNPLFSVAISLLYKKEPLLALVFCPLLDVFYIAEKGKGTYCNGEPVHVSEVADVKDAQFIFSKGRGRDAFAQLHHLFGRVGIEANSFRIFGSAAFEACQVASGRFDGQVNVAVSPWDTIGPAFLIEEAGGRVTNLSGGSFTLLDKGFLATNGKIHEEVLHLFTSSIL